MEDGLNIFNHTSNCQQLELDASPITPPSSVWTLSNEHQSEIEVKDAMNPLKLGNDTDPDDLLPVIQQWKGHSHNAYNSSIPEYVAIKVSSGKLK